MAPDVMCQSTGSLSVGNPVSFSLSPWVKVVGSPSLFSGSTKRIAVPGSAGLSEPSLSSAPVPPGPWAQSTPVTVTPPAPPGNSPDFKSPSISKLLFGALDALSGPTMRTNSAETTIAPAASRSQRVPEPSLRTLILHSPYVLSLRKTRSAVHCYNYRRNTAVMRGRDSVPDYPPCSGSSLSILRSVNHDFT